MHRLIYNAPDDALGQGRAGWWIAAIFITAVLDASFLPCPITTMFVVISLTRPAHTALFAGTAVVGTLIGAAAGYMAGRFLWIDNDGDYTRLALFAFRIIPGFSTESYLKLSELYNTWNIGLIIAASFTALPFGVMSVSAGLFDIHPVVFFVSSLVGQTAKYILVGFVCHRYGAWLFKILKFNWKPWVISATLLFALLAFILKIANH